jgi:hypothetical protein
MQPSSHLTLPLTIFLTVLCLGLRPATAITIKSLDDIPAAAHYFAWEGVNDILLSGCGVDEPYPEDFQNGDNIVSFVIAYRSGMTVTATSVLMDGGGWLNYWTPLMWAIWGGNDAGVEALIKRGANVNVKCFAGYTPLLAAVQMRRYFIAKQLLDHGADTEAEMYQMQSALIMAIGRHDIDFVNLLVQHHASVTSPRVMDAPVGERDLPIMRILIDHGADPNAVRIYFDTTWPQYWAARKRSDQKTRTPVLSVAGKQRSK